MAKKHNSIELFGTSGEPDDNGKITNLFYECPEPFEPVYNKDLPKKQQRWERPKDPNFSHMTVEEKQNYQLKELFRLENGFHFYNNGELVYLTGSHYGFLKHWDLGGGVYPSYRWAHGQMALMQDLCKKDKDCYGLVAYTQKRYGKSEMIPSRMLFDSLLRPKASYFLQATKDDKAQALFQRTLNAFLSLSNSLPYIYQHTYKNDSIFFKQNQTIKRSSDKVTFKDGNFTRIEALPSKITSIQGERVTEFFLDEFASQELMDMEQLFGTLIAQCTEGTRDIIGKIWLVSTVENGTAKAVPFSKELWYDSNPFERDLNGRTKSGLYRMLIPYYKSDPSFIDEYGNPKEEEAKQFFSNMCGGASDSKKALLKRQFPEKIDDIFDVNRGGGLEIDVIEILRQREKQLKGTPQPMYKILKNSATKEVDVTPMAKGEDENELAVQIFEHPQEHHLYRAGLDATSTDTNSTNKNNDGSEKGKAKSKYALVIQRITGANQYIDVANICIRPDKRAMVEKAALWLCMYYNKFGGLRAYPERNASAGSTISDLFETEGQQRLLIRQLTKHNTEKLLEKSTNAYGIYIDGNNKVYRTSVMNKYLRLYGHQINSLRIVQDLLIYGSANADLSDAYGVGCMACGNFDPETQQELKEKPRRPTILSKIENGITIWYELESGKPIEA